MFAGVWGFVNHIRIRVIVRKKTGLCGENSQTGGRVSASWEFFQHNPVFFLTMTLTWSCTWTLWEQGLLKWLTKEVWALQRILMKKMLKTAKHHPEVTFCLACWLAVKRKLSVPTPTSSHPRQKVPWQDVGGCEGSGFNLDLRDPGL